MIPFRIKGHYIYVREAKVQALVTMPGNDNLTIQKNNVEIW